MIYRSLMIPGMMAGMALVLASPSFADEPRLKGGSQSPVMQELDKMSAEQQQQQREGEQRGRGDYSPSEERDRVFRHLQLDDATKTKLTQQLQQLDQKGEDLRRQRLDAFHNLREKAKALQGTEGGTSAAPPKDDGSLKQALDRLYAAEDALAALHQERQRVWRDNLTPAQQAKLVMFRGREMREHMGQERGGPGGPDGARRGHRPSQ
jgi:hypothetical protein